MSYVHNVVLLGSISLETSEAFAQLQAWLVATYRGQSFAVVENEVGGFKALEALVATAAFNYGPSRAELLAKLRELPWPPEACLTLAFCGQDDYGWSTDVVKAEQSDA